ncbi:Brefeldin A-inhibited guanine nucleotide-exchange protein 2 [Phlyctochytrium planicorne]|nr:Brefeldin A-inhibited guanine nucleotide-exchange protein 2 [Phlyctochytrium planicorne]
MAELIKSCLDRLLVESSGTAANIVGSGGAKVVKELRESITTAMEELSEEKDKVLSKGGNPLTDISADLYWLPFRLGCQPTMGPKIREISLDCLQKLIAHKILRGALPLSTSPLGISAIGATPTPPNATPVISSGWFGRTKSTNPPVPTDAAQPDFSTLDTSSPAPTRTPSETALGSSQDRRGSQVSRPSDAGSSGTPSFLIDDIVHTVCTAFTGSSTDDTVQLQVIKVLLTAITSTACEIHGVSLLKVIQSCFNIHIHSKSQGNQVTAKASLTQMINLIFSRMERYSEVLLKSGDLLSGAESIRIAQGGQASSKASSSSAGAEVNGTDGEDQATNAVDLDNSSSTNETLADVESIKKDISQVEFEDRPTEEVVAPAPESVPTQAEPISEVAEEEISEQTKDATMAHVEEQEPTSEAPAAVEDLPPLPADTTIQITPANVAESEAVSPPNPYDPTIAYYNELLRKDAFLVFRLLCRLSTQTDQGPPSLAATFNAASVAAAAALPPTDDVSPLTVRARTLAMELILSILNNAGPVLQTDELYSEVIRVHLCAGVSRNSITTNPMLFELSLSIFLMLIRFYRAKLKTEVEVLLNTVYLHILEMGNSTYKQKSLVLQGLLKICEDPQTLVDLYVNYDCDLNSVSIFERIVSVCARVAQGKESTVAAAPMTLMGYAASAAGLGDRTELLRAQDRRLRLRGLVCLVAIVNSLVDWSSEIGPRISMTSKIQYVSDTPSGNTPANTPQVTDLPHGQERPRSPPSTITTSSSALTSPQRSFDAAKSNNASLEMVAKSFLDALAPSAQSSVVVMNKKPLNSVSMHTSLYSQANSSTGSLDPLNSSHGTLPSLLPSSQNGAETSAEEIATRKQQLRQGLKLFEQKPNKGVKFLIEHGFVEDTPEAIAKFFLNNQGLNKSAIGDYIGDGDAFCIKVMHAFVDSIDFTGLGFVQALRSFLQAFRLPGEAQKISRLMEKFADRFCENNPGLFAKADTAYILAYSVIMLNTDQHSKQIKVRMDKQAFIANNRGINDNADLPESFLTAIFDEIKENEIIMEEEQAGQFAQLALGWGAGSAGDRQRMDLYRKEVAHIQKKSQMLIKSAGLNRSATPFRSAAVPDLARPMFSSASWALMAAFSLLFESAVDDLEDGDAPAPEPGRKSVVGGNGSEEPKVYDLCLQGFAGSIRIASIFRLETERDAFVTSLSKLTGLSHIGEIRPKNIKVIKTLIALANTLGEYLESSWVHVLKIISLMERLQLIGNKAGADPFSALAKRGSETSRRSQDGTSTTYSFFGTASTTSGGSGRSSIASKASPEDHILSSTTAAASFRPSPALELLIADFSSQSTMVAVDRIFSSTVALSGSAITHFFRALVLVSLEEVGLDASAMLTGSAGGSTGAPGSSSPGILAAPLVPLKDTPPRMYLLQKVVELADYNMLRIRYEWSQIWRTLQPYFNTIGCHPHPGVSTFAVDALRQINMKFLEKEELEHFSTQNELLKSFEFIMKNNSDPNIRELLLNSLSQMIAARAGSIRSGWKSIFIVLSKTLQSKDTGDRLIETAFRVVQMTFKEHFSVVSHAGGFVDYVSCVTEFAMIKSTTLSPTVLDDVVSGSILLLEHCGKHLAELAKEELEDTRERQKKGMPPAKSSPVVVSPALASPDPTQLHARAPTQPYILPTGIISEEHFVLKWFPILSSLSRVAGDSENLNVKTRALDALFETLRSAGRFFDSKYWKNIHRSVILPIFEDLKEFSRSEAESTSDKLPQAISLPKEGSSAIWIQGLRLIVELFTDVFDIVAGDTGIVADVLNLSVSMLKIRDEKLATSGQICLHQFIQKNVGRFGKADCWNLVTDAIESAFEITSPCELLNCDYGAKGNSAYPMSPSTPISAKEISPALAEVLAIGREAALRMAPKTTLETLDFEHTIVKCVTHIEMIQAIRDIALTELIEAGSGSRRTSAVRRESTSSATTTSTSNGLLAPSTPVQTSLADPGRIRVAITIVPRPHRNRWLKCIRESYAVARAFNADHDLRYAIWRRGLVQQMPNLVKQETISLATHIRLLFAVYRAVGDAEFAPAASNLNVPGSVENSEPVAIFDVGEELIRHCMDVLERFVGFLQAGAESPQHNARDVALWGPVVVVIYQELLNMDGWWGVGGFGRRLSVTGLPPEGEVSCERLKKKLPIFFRLGIKMLNADKADVRAVLQAFMERVADEIFGPTEATEQ